MEQRIVGTRFGISQIGDRVQFACRAIYYARNDLLVVLDDRGDIEGQELWRHSFPKILNAITPGPPSYQRTAFADLDGDGQTETLFTYFPVTPGEIPASPLLCFSASGKVKWQFTPGRAIRDTTDEFLPPYRINNIQVLPNRTAGHPWIAVSSNHYLEYPNQIAILDYKGNLKGEYWHSGHLLQTARADLDHDGMDELLLAGVDNGRHQACLLVFDPTNVNGATSYEVGNPFQLQGFGPGGGGRLQPQISAVLNA